MKHLSSETNPDSEKVQVALRHELAQAKTDEGCPAIRSTGRGPQAHDTSMTDRQSGPTLNFRRAHARPLTAIGRWRVLSVTGRNKQQSKAPVPSISSLFFHQTTLSGRHHCQFPLLPPLLLSAPRHSVGAAPQPQRKRGEGDEPTRGRPARRSLAGRRHCSDRPRVPI